MIGYILRRLTQLMPVVLAGSLCIFLMVHAVPGGPVAAMVGENATPERIAALSREFGLDQPIFSQYLQWLGRAIQGDLGISLHSREPVMALIAQRLPATIQLAILATLIGIAIGVPMAIVSALRPASWLDRVLSGFSALALGVPTFWLGVLLILLLAVKFRVFPAASAYHPFWQSPWLAMQHTLLPAATLGIYVSGIFARFLRASVITELQSDYVRTARSKGLAERAVILRHVIRNALLPFVTIVGLMLAGFIGGAVVTESVFTYPGLGRLVIQAISSRDYPLIQGCILVVLVSYTLINLIIDVLYALIDPRIELG